MKRSTRENERFAIGLIGTYPPTRCGIATFTASLATAISSVDPRCSCPVVRSTDGSSENADGSAVVATLLAGSTASRAAAISTIDTFDVVVLQHEFGIYGGADGIEVLDIVDNVEVPVIVVLHTVPRRATSTQQRIIEHLAAVAARVVVQSANACEVLVDLFDVEPEKVQMIPHGATLNLAGEKPGRAASTPATMLTWGLLGPDKGIELGIQALAYLRPFEPMPRYVVVGQTHPHILATEGERYRRSLQATAASLGVDSNVDFDNAYHDTVSLLRLIRKADLVLLPYR
ncbi:MAG: glycosyltransferase, partial [Gaiellaceae bacterium]